MTIAHVYGQTMNDWRQTVDELGEMMIIESLKEQRSDSLVIVAGILNYNTGKRDLLSDVLETHLIEILNQKGKYPLVEYSQIQSHRKEWLELFPDSSPEETSQEIASLLGADWSVTGVYWIKEEQFELQLKLYESETGRVIWQGQTESFAEKLKEPELKISQTREPEQEVELVREILPAEMVDSEMEEASGMIPQTEPVESGASEMEGSVDTVPEDSHIETAVTPSEASTAVTETEKDAGSFPEETPVDVPVSETGQIVDSIPEYLTAGTGVSENEQVTDITSEMTRDETSVAGSEPGAETISGEGPVESAFDESATVSEAPSRVAHSETAVTQSRQGFDPAPEKITTQATAFESGIPPGFIPLFVVSSSSRSGQLKGSEQAKEYSEAPPRVAHSETAVMQSRQGIDPAPEKISTQATAFESGIPPGFIPLFVVSSSSRSGQLKGSEQAKEHSDELAYIGTDESRVSREEESIDSVEAAISERDQDQIRQMEGMVLVPEGRFFMGSKKGEENEKPVHSVYLLSYFIDSHEVTNKEFARCDHCERGKGGFDTTEPDQPVVYVDWQNAEAYCRFVGKRLPTEEEWENSARAGSQTEYSFGNEQQLATYAWYEDNAERVGERYAHTVGTKKPNAWKIFDMHGNVMEWTSDRYVVDYYQKLEDSKPWHMFNYYFHPENDHPFKPNMPPEDETPMRVVRGGAWGGAFGTGKARQLRSAKRFAVKPWVRSFLIGFRCATDWNPFFNQNENR